MRRSLLSLVPLLVLAAAPAPPIALIARFKGDGIAFHTRGVEPDSIGDCLIRVWVEPVAPGGGRGPTIWELDADGSGTCVHWPLSYGAPRPGLRQLDAGAAPRLRPGVAYRVLALGRQRYEGVFRISRDGRHLHLDDRVT